MTSLHSPPASRTAAREPGRAEAEVRRALVTRRPLVATATLGGALAAAGPLLVCLALAVVGWFLTDAGGHGTPSGALRIGALSWLAAHGSGVAVEGIRITAVPLGLTLLCAWSTWRVGHRVGESISGHGPDADRIADGERDWTVPIAGGLFAVGYVVVAVLTATLAATVETAPGTSRVVLWSVVLTLVLGLPALARGSGRAAIWVPAVPLALRDGAALVRTILRTWLLLALVALVLALVTDFSTAANIVSQLDADTADTLMIALLTLAVLPNAMLFCSAYLLGPGFTVGTGTLVSPAAVTLGPLPLFPLLAALPDAGPTPGWTGWLMATPVLVALVAAAWSLRTRPADSWDQAAIRGCGGGLA
uniref:cell division protein PerM n=1 Tax=Nocardioides stalactiti TaxID=2755356 RepID=UPI0016032442